MTLQELNEHFQIRSQIEELYEMRASISSCSLGSQRLDGLPHGTGTADRTAVIATSLAYINALLESKERQLEEQEAVVSAYIDTVTDTRAQIALRLRFLGGFKWVDVASFMGKYETESSVKACIYRYLQSSEKSRGV